MRSAADRPAFAVDGERVRWGRVVEEARRSGAWEAIAATTHEGVACLAADVAAGRAPSRADVHEAAAQWRRARGLTAAEDMEAWLARWDLDVRLFFDHVRRTLARDAHTDDATALATSHPVDDHEELERRVWATAVCSGAIQRAAQDLAGRLAVQARLVAEGDVGPGDDLDEATRRFRRRVVTPDAVDAELGARRLDWIRLEGELLTFSSQDAAFEGRLCLVDDGTTPAELAAATGIPSRRHGTFISDAPEEQRPALLAAQPGGVVGPLARDGAWELLAVTARVLPSPDDTEVRRRAALALWSRTLAHEVDEHVTWPTSP